MVNNIERMYRVNELLLQVVLFLIGFVFLTGGAELLVRGASRLAASLKVPPVVIGLTIVAFGTSLPELLVSLLANLQGNGGSDIAIGNIVGSNIANLLLILGIATVMAVIPVERHLLRREYLILLVVSFVFVLMVWNGVIHRWEGVLLMLGLVGFTYYSYSADRASVKEGEHALDVVDSIDPAIGLRSTKPLIDVILVIVGLGVLVLGANLLIDAAQVIARALGVGELVIGLTLVAVGTSLPELATTIIAVRRNERDIAVGNVVGSNLFNMLFIGGLSALIKPLSAPVSMRSVDLPLMLGVTMLVYAFAWRWPHRLVRWQGILLLGIYIAYTAWLFRNGGG